MKKAAFTWVVLLLSVTLSFAQRGYGRSYPTCNQRTYVQSNRPYYPQNTRYVSPQNYQRTNYNNRPAYTQQRQNTQVRYANNRPTQQNTYYYQNARNAHTQNVNSNRGQSSNSAAKNFLVNVTKNAVQDALDDEAADALFLFF